jgi:pyrroloquinoline quinone biosynthesis protein A
MLFAKNKLGDTIMWTKPAATEMRFGFEVTMYVMNK